MKFLILTNHSYMLWHFRLPLLQELQKRGEVVLSMPFVGHEDDFQNAGFRCIETPVDRRGLNPLKDLKLLLFYRKLLRQEKPDMVVTYSIKPNIYGAWLCKQYGIPCCVNVQGLGTAFQGKAIAAIATFLYRQSIKKAKAVFFENKGNAEEFVRRRILPEEKPVVLNGAGVDTAYYAYKPYPPEAEGVHFLYLGRIMREKGVAEFFSAAQALKEKYGDAVQFDLVGFFEDDLEPRAKELQAEGIIRCLGFQPDPRPFYEATHCVVLPSYHEGMSNVLLEGASTGRALITTDIPGCREAVEDGVNGYLCRKMDAASLQDRLERFLKLSPEQREEMGLAGRRLIEEKFEKKTVVAETLRHILA